MRGHVKINFLNLPDPLLILPTALLLDLIFGEPPEKVHPTVWMGSLIEHLKPKGGRDGRTERINGVLFGLTIIFIFTFSFQLLLTLVRLVLGRAAYIIAAAIILKTTFSIRCMRSYASEIFRALMMSDEDQARRILPYLVRRDPARLDRKHIISATIESISEGTVDGVTSPLFYFALFGVLGSVAFRAVNTLDSMVGYKDRLHMNIGWFSARMDTIANFIPARLTSLLMILAAPVTGGSMRSAWRILLKSRGDTESLNAGWPMSAAAGILGVQLEKEGYYRLGEDQNPLTPEHILKALRIMYVTILLFILAVTVPLLALRLTLPVNVGW